MALADKTETQAWALANHTYDVGLAPLDSSYLTSQTTADGTYENALATAESGRVTDLSTANTQFATAQNTAESNYRTADHTGRVLSLGNLNTAANLPFTDYQAQRATAEQSAWQTVQTDFTNTSNSINTETTTYDNLVAGQITGLASTSTTAQQTYIGSVAPAIETRDTTSAGAWKLYDEQSSNAEEFYQQQIALANRNHTAALAQAERNLAVNNDQTAYDNAVALANSELEDAKLTAARNYAIAEIGAQGSRDITLHSANSTLDTTEGTAHIARTSTETSAIRDAEIADAEGFRDMLLNIADDLANRNELAATTLETDLTNLASTNGTPWSYLGRDKVTARRSFLVDRNDANQTYLQTNGSDQVVFETTESNASHTKNNEQTQAIVDLQNNRNTALSTLQNSEHTTFQAGIDLGLSLEENGPIDLQPNPVSIGDAQSTENEYCQDSSILNDWDTLDLETFYNTFMETEGTISLSDLILNDTATDSLGEATEKSEGVLDRITTLSNKHPFDHESALASMESGGQAFFSVSSGPSGGNSGTGYSYSFLGENFRFRYPDIKAGKISLRGERSIPEPMLQEYFSIYWEHHVGAFHLGFGDNLKQTDKSSRQILEESINEMRATLASFGFRDVEKWEPNERELRAVIKRMEELQRLGKQGAQETARREEIRRRKAIEQLINPIVARNI